MFYRFFDVIKKLFPAFHYSLCDPFDKMRLHFYGMSWFGDRTIEIFFENLLSHENILLIFVGR